MNYKIRQMIYCMNISMYKKCKHKDRREIDGNDGNETVKFGKQFVLEVKIYCSCS